MRVFDSFDIIRIINLAHRTDRRLEMVEQLKRVGLGEDPRVNFFDAIRGTTRSLFYSEGAHGVFLSHRTILQHAAEAGHSVLILEDDCDFLPGAADRDMPDRWDIFYGGYEASNPADPANSNIIGAHCMGFSPRAAQAAATYFAKYLEQDFIADALAVSEPNYNPSLRPGVDGGYVWFRRAHPHLVTVFEKLSVQRSSRTDIGRVSWFDEVPGIRDLAGYARRLRDRLRGGARPMSRQNADFGRVDEEGRR